MIETKKKFILLVVCSFMVTSSATAIVVPDASFEGLAPSGWWAYVNVVTSPWDCSTGNASGAWIGDNYVQGYGYPQVGHDGLAYVDMNGTYVYQTLSDTYIEGVTYALSVWATTGQDDSGQRVFIYFQDDVGDIAASGALDIPMSSGGTHDWYPYNLNYTATATDAGKNITIMFWGDGDAYIDDITLDTSGVPDDSTPPDPDPMAWSSAPAASSSYSITMTATTATDPSGVQYYFQCTAGGGNNSSWQSSPIYEDTGLTPETQYTYRVKARDFSTAQNETGYSATEPATTDADTSSSTITNGLIGYWPMDKGSGSTAADISVNGNDGSINGAAWTTGKFGNGLDFNGSSTYVNCGTSGDLRPSEALTVSAWVKPDSFGNYAGIAANIHDTSSTESGYILMTRNSSFGAGVCGSDGVISYFNGGAYSTGAWYHVMFTNDGSTTRLYVNGALVSSVGENTPIDYSPTSTFEIGRYNDDDEDYWFDGIIDEVVVWDRALDQAEITYLYNNSPIGSVPAVMITETLDSTEVDEGGDTDSYDIVLYSSPASDVLITVTPGDSQIDIGSGPGVARVLTFTADPGGDWDSPQTITVAADDDAVYEPDDDPHTTTITHTSQSVDSDYDDIPVKSVSVAVYDNDLGCGSWGYLDSDINKDCYVNLLDFAILAEKWLFP